MIGGDITGRLIEQVWAWQDGHTGQVLTWLQQLGCHILSRPEFGQTWTLQGIAGGTTTLCTGQDPIATATGIAFLCAGMFWPQVFPTLLKHINEEYTRQCRAVREKKSKI